MFDLTILGLENVPTDGPAIIAANHTSVLDSFIVPSVLPRNISYVGKAEYLDDWKTKHIFPKGRTGVARLSHRTGAPIIPVGLMGMRDIQPPDAPFPKFFNAATISFGQPLFPDEHGDPGTDPMAFRAMTDALMFRIRHLSGQQYINRYAPSKAELEAQNDPSVLNERYDIMADKPLDERRTGTDLLNA